MAHSILLLPGDGIGPEIMGPVGSLLERIGMVTGQPLTLETAWGAVIDRGHALALSQLEAARRPTRSSWARWADQSGCAADGATSGARALGSALARALCEPAPIILLQLASASPPAEPVAGLDILIVRVSPAGSFR